MKKIFSAQQKLFYCDIVFRTFNYLFLLGIGIRYYATHTRSNPDHATFFDRVESLLLSLHTFLAFLTWNFTLPSFLQLPKHPFPADWSGISLLSGSIQLKLIFFTRVCVSAPRVPLCENLETCVNLPWVPRWRLTENGVGKMKWILLQFHQFQPGLWRIFACRFKIFKIFISRARLWRSDLWC